MAGVKWFASEWLVFSWHALQQQALRPHSAMSASLLICCEANEAMHRTRLQNGRHLGLEFRENLVARQWQRR